MLVTMIFLQSRSNKSAKSNAGSIQVFAKLINSERRPNLELRKQKELLWKLSRKLQKKLQIGKLLKSLKGFLLGHQKMKLQDAKWLAVQEL